MIVVLLLPLLLNAQDALSAGELRERIQRTIDTYFPEVSPERRKVYTERLAQPLLTTTTPEKTKEILAALPQLASHHASVMDDYKRRSRLFVPPRDLILEGFDVQVDQMAGGIGRALRRDRSAAALAAESAQVEAIMSATKQVLREKLPGELGATYAERQIEPFREGWLKSLETPFNSVLHAPLTTDQVDSVISEIRRSVQNVIPVELTEEMLFKPDLLRTAGVHRIVQTVRNTMYKASQLSLGDEPRLATAEKEWVAKLDAAQDAFFREERRKHEEAKRASREKVQGPDSLPSPEVVRPAWTALQPRSSAYRSENAVGTHGSDGASRSQALVRRKGISARLLVLCFIAAGGAIWLTARRIVSPVLLFLGLVGLVGGGVILAIVLGEQDSVERADADWVHTKPQKEDGAARIVDLLQSVEATRDGVGAQWGFDGTILVTPGVAFARLHFPCEPADEYDVEVVAERMSGSESLAIGLSAGAARFVAVIDGYGGKSGLDLLDGKAFIENETTYRGQLFAEGKTSTILCEVRRAGVSVTVDGKKIIDWQGDLGRLSLFPRWKDSQRGPLFIGSWTSPYRIHRVTLKTVSSGGKKPG